ncbi:MAG: hypothetical protein LQ351_003211 [Letrouitia transgressa]|nr:MAG: hypothetical protein LQ351_003211 [Letrouitia transgressa]
MIILITGANSGIGYDTAFVLANDSPNNHVIMSARSAERGKKAFAEIQARKPVGTLSFLELDITSDASIDAAAQKLAADFGVIDVLVNNAAIAVSDPVSRMTLAQTFDTNLFGVVLLTQALEPLLKKSKEPRIINVSSGLGSIAKRLDHTYAFSATAANEYRMSKAALNMFTATLSWEYKDWEHPPKSFAYCPGFVITNLTGEEDRENRRKNGAESSELSAIGISAVVQGKRDGDNHQIVTHKGGLTPW